MELNVATFVWLTIVAVTIIIKEGGDNLLAYPAYIYESDGKSVVDLADFEFTVSADTQVAAMSIAVEIVSAVCHWRLGKGVPLPKPTEFQLLTKVPKGKVTLVYVEE